MYTMYGYRVASGRQVEFETIKGFDPKSTRRPVKYACQLLNNVVIN